HTRFSRDWSSDVCSSDLSLTHWYSVDYWSGHFSLINLTNNVLSAADSLDNLTEGTLTNIGEAKFLRAWAYFNLVRTFGEVPIIRSEERRVGKECSSRPSP